MRHLWPVLDTLAPMAALGIVLAVMVYAVTASPDPSRWLRSHLRRGLEEILQYLTTLTAAGLCRREPGWKRHLPPGHPDLTGTLRRREKKAWARCEQAYHEPSHGPLPQRRERP